MIVLRCSHCQGLMKVDDGRLPSDGPGTVRCPHCGRVCPADRSRDLSDQLQAASKGAHTDTVASSTPRSETGEKSPPAPSGGPTERSEAAAPSSKDDDDFLFPAEQGRKRSRKRSWSTGAKAILWTVLSLSVIGFFAFLVNVLLPGPPTSSIGTGIVGKDKAPVNAFDWRVGNDRKASDEMSGRRR